MSLPKTTISTCTRPTCTCVHLSNYWHVLMHVGLPWTYMNLVLPEGARKLGGGEGMQSKWYICTCPVVLHRFVDICQQVFGLFFTYDTTCNLLAGICNHQRKRVWLGGGGGGGAIAARGVAFHMPWGRGGKLAPPPPRLCLIQGCMVST